MRISILVRMVWVFMLTNLSSGAANLYWDGGTNDIVPAGDGVSAGGSGIWNTSITNWDQGNASNHIAWPAAANANKAFFAGSGGTVTFGSDFGPFGNYPNDVNVTAGNYVFDLGTNGLSFRGSGLTVSGATLVLTNGTVSLLNGVIPVTGANALRIYSKVSGAAVFFKSGGGDVYLYNDANDFTNTLYGQNGLGVYFTSIKNSGVASAAGSGNTVETGINNTMNYIGPGDSTDRILSLFGGGNDTLNSSGSGALIWAGPFANSKSGASTLNLGGSNTSTNEFKGNLTNSAAGALGVNKADAGRWILSGTNTYSGATTIAGGALRIAHGAGLGSTLTGTVQTGTSALELDGAIAPVVVGAEALSLAGEGLSSGGALRNIAGNNSYGGTISLTAQSRINSDSGTLTLGHPEAVAGAAQNLLLGGAGNVAIQGSLVVSNLIKDGAGTLTLAGTNTVPGNLTINAGRLVLGGGVSTNVGQVLFNSAGASMILTNGASLFTSNGLSAGFPSSGNTIAMYSNTVWNLRGLSNPGNSISGTSNRFLVADGAIVTNTFGVGNILAVNGSYCTIEIVNGGKMYLQNGNVLFGQFVSRENRILVGGGGAPAYLLTAPNLVQIPQNDSSVADYGIVVSNGLWDAGPVLLGRSTSTGNYIHVLAGGVVNFAGNNLSIADTGAGISNYVMVADGGLVTNVSQIAVNSNNSVYVDGGTIAAGANGTLLAGAGKAYIQAGGATIDTVAFTTTSAMGLTEDPASTGGGLTKRGAGTLNLFAVNTYSGTTLVHAGTLALIAPGSVGNSPLISVAAGATLNAGTGFTLGVGQTLAGAGTVVSNIVVSGAVSPGVSGLGTLTASDRVTWNAGVAWPFELGAASASDRLAIQGSFTKGSGSGFVFDLQNTGAAGVYTLVTWAVSTDFVGADFAANNIPGGLTPAFSISGNELLLTLSGGGGGFSAGSTNTSFALVSGRVTLGFNIASGALYQVQASTNLMAAVDNGFTNITERLTNTQAGTIIYTNTTTDSLRMFRIFSP